MFLSAEPPHSPPRAVITSHLDTPPVYSPVVRLNWEEVNSAPVHVTHRGLRETGTNTFTAPSLFSFCLCLLCGFDHFTLSCVQLHQGQLFDTFYLLRRLTKCWKCTLDDDCYIWLDWDRLFVNEKCPVWASDAALCEFRTQRGGGVNRKHVWAASSSVLLQSLSSFSHRYNPLSTTIDRCHPSSDRLKQVSTFLCPNEQWI